jgi:non-ribosomal peptide synthase protein (TIGR01720 family)
LLVELEGHGREEIPGTALEGADLSRSLGWFTSIFPVYFELQSAKGNAQLLHEISRQVHQVPNRGIGYGLLRYLCEDQYVRQTLSNIPQPDINFNYLGQFDQTGVEIPGIPEASTPDGQVRENQRNSAEGAQEAALELAPEFSGAEQNPDSHRSSKLYVVAIVNGGQLSLRLLYSRGLHDRTTIERWAGIYLDHVRALLEEMR